MNKKDFSQAMNQIHLEVSLLEILVCQAQAKADENNLNILISALTIADDKAVLTEENGAKVLLCRYAEEFQELCRTAIENPSLLKPFPKLYNATFQVLLRTLYFCYLFDEMEATMNALADVLIAVDEIVPEEAYQAFLYWFNSFDMCLEKVVQFPRVKRQLEDFMLQQKVANQTLGASFGVAKKRKGEDDGSMLN